MSERGQLPEDAIWTFMFAGKALFTVQSPSGVHRTFKILKVQGEGYKRPIWSVMAMTGPDNTSTYRNIGYIIGTPEKHDVTFRGNAKLPENHGLIQAFVWVLERANRGNFDTKHGRAHVYHEGRCGKCGKLLTVPASVQRGLGPQCALNSLGA